MLLYDVIGIEGKTQLRKGKAADAEITNNNVIF
jgi:hypothetical protein